MPTAGGRTRQLLEGCGEGRTRTISFQDPSDVSRLYGYVDVLILVHEGRRTGLFHRVTRVFTWRGQ